MLRALQAWPQRRWVAALVVTSVLAGMLAASYVAVAALTWFEPVQPVLQVAAVGLLGWAVAQRLRGEVACPV